jgi:hypothetical protein
MTLCLVSMSDCIVDEIALYCPSAVLFQSRLTAQYPEAVVAGNERTACYGNQYDMHLRGSVVAGHPGRLRWREKLQCAGRDIRLPGAESCIGDE